MMKVKALLISFHDPNDCTYGAGIRTHMILRSLTSIMHTDVLYIHNYKEEVLHSMLSEDLGGGLFIRIGVKSKKNPAHSTLLAIYSRLIEKLVLENVEIYEYHLLFFRYIVPFCKIRLPLNVPVIVDFDDALPIRLQKLRFTRQSLKKYMIDNANRLFVGSMLRRKESRRVKYLFVSPADRKHYSELDGSVLPNIPYIKRGTVSDGALSCTSRNTILFVGLNTWQPNIEAIDAFLAFSWPIILKKIPNAKLRIVGRCLEKKAQEWSRVSGCTVVGYVDDVAKEYRRTAICVIPIISGGGSNIKLVEAAGYKRAIVCSRFSFDKWKEYFTSERDLLMADDFGLNRPGYRGGSNT